jgi:hypothetical protein
MLGHNGGAVNYKSDAEDRRLVRKREITRLI